MRKYFKETRLEVAKKLLPVVLTFCLVLVSCNEYVYEDQEPSWLGSSIYDYLKSDGHYKNYTKLIEDLNYAEVLGKTGSKTIFVANDSAFDEFYKKNEWGVTSYEQFSFSQKKLLLFYGMINNAYLVDMLPNYYYNSTLNENVAFRRESAISVMDSLTFEKPDKMPGTSYWNYYKTTKNGMYLLKDNTTPTLMYFVPNFLTTAQITDNDFKILTGENRSSEDAFLFNSKIIKRDITCKNGYINVINKVMIPPVNMAEYINNSTELSIFNKLLSRFCAPYYDAKTTQSYKQLYPSFTDSIFVKKYFTNANGGGRTSTPTGNSIPSSSLLTFDPGWNNYYKQTTSTYTPLQLDAAAMLVPTDEAMQSYFNGAGAVLKDRFGSWDNVPTDVLPSLLNRHMRNSLLQTIPSHFGTMVDADNSPVSVSPSDIVKTYIGSNGVVYETSKVYAPDDYASVYGPVLLSANNVSTKNKTKVWNWAIAQNDFRLYLNSLISKYSFFVPTDEYFSKYIDPISLGKDVTAALRYWYDDINSTVRATAYKYNTSTGVVGDSIGYITSNTFIVNRLLDLLNSHIVVNGVEAGKNYYVSKGNVALKISGSGEAMTIQAGGNMALGEKVNVNKMYAQTNGNTYLIDKPIQAPFNSVYKVLSTTPEFSQFFNLMVGFPSNSSSVLFVSKANYYGIDQTVKLFNTFNYTLYVPTNKAIKTAIVNGAIVPWNSLDTIVNGQVKHITGINDMIDATQKAIATTNLELFLRYHFQDNSVFVDNQSVNTTYQSAALKLNQDPSYFGTLENKYYKIGVNAQSGSIKLTTENRGSANVITSNDKLYNIMTRDYVFSDKPVNYKNVDGTGSGKEYSTSQIYTSSTCVIHQIDNVLSFK
jgi:uncharacterized surface protein with fasciclin (FAS1) repeats